MQVSMTPSQGGTLPQFNFTVSGSNEPVDTVRQVTQWVSLGQTPMTGSVQKNYILDNLPYKTKWLQVKTDTLNGASAGAFKVFVKWNKPQP